MEDFIAKPNVIARCGLLIEQLKAAGSANWKINNPF